MVIYFTCCIFLCPSIITFLSLIQLNMPTSDRFRDFSQGATNFSCTVIFVSQLGFTYLSVNCLLPNFTDRFFICSCSFAALCTSHLLGWKVCWYCFPALFILHTPLLHYQELTPKAPKKVQPFKLFNWLKINTSQWKMYQLVFAVCCWWTEREIYLHVIIFSLLFCDWFCRLITVVAKQNAQKGTISFQQPWMEHVLEYQNSAVVNCLFIYFKVAYRGDTTELMRLCIYMGYISNEEQLR